MKTLSSWVLSHRRAVALAWLVITIAGVLVAPTVSGRLRSNFKLDSAGYRANLAIGERFGGLGSNPSVLILTFPAGVTGSAGAGLAALQAVDAAAQTSPGVRALSYGNTAAPVLLGQGGRSAIVLVYPPVAGTDAVDPALMTTLGQAAVRTAPGTRADVTGVEQLSTGTSGNGSSVLTEVVVGAVAALAILAWVFGSAIAVVPLLTSLISILAMLLAVDGLTRLFPGTRFNPAIEAIVAILGLGLSIDYALLVVTRWRENRERGLDNHLAVDAASQDAGRAVLVSGLTASVGLFGLVVIPVSFVRGVALAGLVIPSTAALVAVTLLPVVLRTAGPSLDRHRLRRTRRADDRWARWARLVVRRRWVAACGGALVLGVLAVCAAQINVALPSLQSLAAQGPARDGLSRFTADGFPEGVLTALPVLVPPGRDAASVARDLSSAQGVVAAFPTTGPSWRADDGTTIAMVVPRQQIGGAGQGGTLAAIRRAAPSADAVGGNEVVQHDNTHAIYSAFPQALAVVALITFILLVRAFRSLLLALKAVLLNLLSVAATYGATVLVWQKGWGLHTLFGLDATGAVNGLAPVLLFGFLFGLSMDYEVFILSRMREARDQGETTNGAVVVGIGRTGRLVTSAALILFAALVSLASAPDPTVKIIATGLAIGVLLDALVVRSLLAPALVSLFDRANWWLPAPLGRLLRVHHPAEPS